MSRIAIRIIADRYALTLGTINRHKAHVAHLVAAADTRVAKVEQQYQGALAEQGALLVQRADERHGVAMRLANRAEAALERLERFQEEFEAYATRGAGGDMVDPAELDDSFSQRAEAVAKLAASAASTLTAAISALGGGAGKHDELRGKLTGELKPATVQVDIKAAMAVLIDPKTNRLSPEVQAKLDAEGRKYLSAAIDAMALRVPIAERQAAREAAWSAAKAARESEGGS